MFHYVYSLKALWLITGGQSFKKRYEHKMHDKLEHRLKEILKNMLKDKNIFNGNIGPSTFDVKYTLDVTEQVIFVRLGIKEVENMQECQR